MGTHYKGTPAEVRALDSYIKLMRGANSVDGRLESRLIAQGLTESQFGVLEILLHLGPQTPGTLKEKLFTTGGNITMIVDNLERRQFVKRVPDPNDRRRVNVRLTPTGRRTIASLFPQHLAAIVGEFSVLTAVEQEQLGHLCKKLGRRD